MENSFVISNFVDNYRNAMHSRYFKATSWLKSLLSCFNNLFFLLTQLSDKIPKFDLREQLVLIGIGLPFILDVVTWFMSPLRDTILHIIDIAAFGLFAFFLSRGIMGTFELTNTIVCIVCGLIFLYKLYRFVKKLFGEKVTYEAFDE